MSSRSTGASTSTPAGGASATTSGCRGISTRRCCSARSSWSSTGRARCSSGRPGARATSSISATACCRAVRSRTCRRWSRPSAKVSPRLPESQSVLHAPLPNPLPEGERGKTAVMCMAYGSPDGEEGIEPYYTHIRGGRPPSAESLAELRGRYRAIGGSPLTEITRPQARALAERLEMPVFAGMKHAPPFIADAAAEARAAGVERLVGLPLAPHYAEMSLGAYLAALRKAWDADLILVRGFHDHPAFVTAVRALLDDALAGFEPDRIFFTAHSLPARIEAAGDRYRERLLESCRLVAAGSQLPEWEFAFQSASPTGEPWLGPDLLEALAHAGVRRALVCPIGFVADHLEILYDIDVEAMAFARQHGIEMRRTQSFNARPEFIDALAAVVRDAANTDSRPQGARIMEA